MAALSGTQCFCAVLLTVVLTWLPGEAVYFESVYSQKQERRGSASTERQRRGRGERTRNNEDDGDEETLTNRRTERRREPFQRTMVLCFTDDECDRKHFCHGGEGHKSCVPCRKSRKRCHRNEMCCKGYTCQEGRCRAKRGAESDTTGADEDGMSFSEAEDSFWNREVPRKKQHGEACENGDDCQEGLCCARHLWSKVCMPLLDEGDLCTKKKDRSEFYQRCDCMAGLSCKRVPNVNTRLHACFPVKTFPLPPADSEPMSSPAADGIINEVPIPSSSTKRKRQSSLLQESEEKAVVVAYSVGTTDPSRTKSFESFQEKDSEEMVLS